ncbi:nucleotidyltransferase domain-containing protein [Kribbella qitaiheensis]|uniref:Nucleotidyltransferase domain-containing protein n=1 Tax=Kribbella qitaiheensis TaxID=1544730 RepID=A0A7G6X076_9ACTN|nr:nucleotidyltransferase domain-containing protein [Kribbella qitaiheensis]QNE19641.1 nucleotidyltransferase domain-containing protein [Kribbella qitaiheensis]
MSNPISTVVQTVDGPVLDVLARTTAPLTGRKIHQLAAAGSETGIRNVLRRLAGTGLVMATEVGPSVQYKLNRDHLAAKAVLELATLRLRLFDSIRAEIQGWHIQPMHASVFGSTARGDGGVSSDVDLLVVHKFSDAEDPTQAWTDQMTDLADRVYRWSGNHLQVYELSSLGFLQHVQAGESIVKDWRRDAVTVSGPEFRVFMNIHVHEESTQ